MAYAGYDAIIETVGRTLRLQMLGTTGFIFVAFYFFVLSTMNAITFQLRDGGDQLF